MYLLTAFPLVLATFWLVVFFRRCLSGRSTRLRRETQIVWAASMCEGWLQHAAAAPRLSDQWTQCLMKAEGFALQAFVAARFPPSCRPYAPPRMRQSRAAEHPRARAIEENGGTCDECRSEFAEYHYRSGAGIGGKKGFR
jgi:hypothetical protein